MGAIDDHKERMFSEYWVEQRHEYLASLPNEVARQVLESLDANDVTCNVNIRRFQQDYIADYLQYVWSISPDAFWRHVHICLQHSDGLVQSDNPFYLEKMRDEQMPDNLWPAVLEYVEQHREDKQLSEGICEIIMGQTHKGADATNKREQLVRWIREVTPEQRSHVSATLRKNLGERYVNQLLGKRR